MKQKTTYLKRNTFMTMHFTIFNKLFNKLYKFQAFIVIASKCNEISGC